MIYLPTILMLLAVTVVQASPTLGTDPVDPLTTHCGWSIDGSSRQDQSVAQWGGQKFCVMDLAGLANRSHVLNVNVSYTDSTWGKRSSLPSADFTTVPAPIPAQPTGLGYRDIPAPTGLKIFSIIGVADRV